MRTANWIELSLFVGLLALLTPALGAYLVQVLEPGGRTGLDRIFGPLERGTYRVLGVDPRVEHNWKQYAVAVLVFNAMNAAVTYTILRTQHTLPLNPEGWAGLSPTLALNTAVSFITNTDWQCYAGETSLSYLSQMLALGLPNFTSAATGMAVAAALVRGVARPSGTTLGNFWVDLIRLTYYLLLPLCVVYALFLVSQGVVQNFEPSIVAKTVATASVESATGQGTATETAAAPQSPTIAEGSAVREQRIVQGPMASMGAIKMLGTNGGGFTNANAAHPFENPTPLSNFVQMLSIFVLGSALTGYLGRVTGRPAHGWAVWGAMMGLFVIGATLCAWAEARGNPMHHALGVSADLGNMEGKEVRFGVFDSSLFATITTAASCGAVNSMHDSFTPLGGLVPLFNMQLGEVLVGGVGSGLYGMLVFVLLAVFIAGLLVGRSPEYCGKKIQAFEVQMAMLAVLAPGIAILLFAAWAAASPWGVAGVNNAGPHGWSEILYAFTSAGANNGSAFAGLDANTPAYHLSLATVMWLGRLLVLVPVLALAGSLRAQRTSPPGPGSFPVTGFTFIVLLEGTILLLGALSFLPALALGPVVEHFLNAGGILH